MQSPLRRSTLPPKHTLRQVPRIWKALLSDVQSRFPPGIRPRIAVNVGCHYCAVDNAADPRVFAHTRHIPNTICIHPNIDNLPEAHIRGILAHEVGHIMAGEIFGDWSEEAADTFCIDYLHYPLDYDMYHGMWLQRIAI